MLAAGDDGFSFARRPNDRTCTTGDKSASTISGVSFIISREDNADARRLSVIALAKDDVEGAIRAACVCSKVCLVC